ncbi:DUF4142 domain-containing protein [Mesorhizobium sp. M6A.T.Ce.TU.002.03.1.1]|uniref:DUF4142 domain-containing protein n=1 Tax=unclassified Mesorhizobium TaxID=325217 RepID=UPI000F75A3DB|nr:MULTISPECIES: DUF4142 domain-containing protein [unclassified Mesorhizobium]AZO66233.1 DUF4142 domain-containing protein [Mesorhizobium sp. M6A.T.Cr.TU.016.01.1.1]RUU46645.1 DUF4142 domain-containing protein [Mesorhizobium sp. M6A.T.Ce.TU.002.03.1.1]RWP76787.1 MAG: DUF4142 domain-containing protein [Mesorhizobium sp.]
MRVLATTLGLTALCASPLFAQIGNPAGNAPDTLMDSPGQPMPHQANYQDQLFAQLAVAGGTAEVDFGNLAKKSSHSAIKEFASRMVDDHSAANEKLKSLAESDKIPLPQGLDDEHKQLRAKLEKLEGAAFDLAYISGQITDHQRTVQLLEWEIVSGQDADLQHFGSDTLPTVLEHLRMARDIKAKLASQALADAASGPPRK